MNLLTDYRLVEQGNDFHVLYKKAIVAIVRPMPRQNYSQYELTLTYDAIGVMAIRQPEDALSYVQSNTKDELELLTQHKHEWLDLNDAIKSKPEGIANRVLREQRRRARMAYEAVRARLEPWCAQEAEYATIKDMVLSSDAFRVTRHTYRFNVDYFGRSIGHVTQNDNGTYTLTMNGNASDEFTSVDNVDEIREHVAQIITDRRIALFTEEWEHRNRELQILQSQTSFLFNTRDLTKREMKIERLTEELDALRLIYVAQLQRPEEQS